ncbi:MAG TPA: ribosome recycling factor [bacterium]|nr:ribosome recycling factor [bacterium]HPJ72889.1 ribosome recycling factor [bacterium]HPQ66176.1 ribosome recycling factor [bacterium]
MLPEEALEEMELKMLKSVDVVKGEFASIRTGKASPALIENIVVDYYGTRSRLRDLAGISTPEARLLVVQPWDPNSLSDIEKAIMQANVGLNPSNDGKIIRIPVPEISEERRRDLVKVIKKIAEEGKVSIRNVRREANHQIEELGKGGKVPEDEKFRFLEEVQTKTDEYVREIEDLLAAKERELLEI